MKARGSLIRIMWTGTVNWGGWRLEEAEVCLSVSRKAGRWRRKGALSWLKLQVLSDNASGACVVTRVLPSQGIS